MNYSSCRPTTSGTCYYSYYKNIRIIIIIITIIGMYVTVTIPVPYHQHRRKGFTILFLHYGLLLCSEKTILVLTFITIVLVINFVMISMILLTKSFLSFMHVWWLLTLEIIGFCNRTHSICRRCNYTKSFFYEHGTRPITNLALFILVKNNGRKSNYLNKEIHRTRSNELTKIFLLLHYLNE